MTETGVEKSAGDAMWRGKFILTFAFLLSFVHNLLRLAGPMFIVLIYDRVLPSRSEETLVSLFGMLVLLVMLMGLFDYSRRRIMARFAAQFQERIEDRLFTATARNEFFAKARSKPTGGLDELDSLRSFWHSSAPITIMDVIWMPMFIGIVFLLHWKLGLICLGGILLLLLLIVLRMFASARREQNAKVASSKIGELKTLLVSSREVIRSQEMTASVKERWLAARQQSRDRAIELKDLTVWFDVYKRQLRLLLQYSVMAAGAYLALHSELTIGAMVAAMFLVSRVFSTVEDFMGDLPAIRKAMQQWADLKRILAAKDAEREDPYNPHAMHQTAKLSVADVTVKSPISNKTILKSLKLNIAAGALVEITGDSGSGKTVLAETILGGWKVSSGAIFVRGVAIDRLSARETAGMCGYVPEVVTFVTGTIAENISRLDVEPQQEQIVVAAKLAQVHELIMSLPDGYQTSIDSTASMFSKGERHRLALARAVYGNPDVLLIDEPDASIGAETQKTLRPVISEMRSRGCVVIVFSRRTLSLPSVTGRLTLEAGKLRRFKVPENVTDLSEKKSGKSSPPKPTEVKYGEPQASQ